MKKFNKKLGRSRSGVSDIIGNLLILAITVTLFSSVLFFVTNMPAPAEATFTDLEPSLSNVEGTSPAYSIWINVTHKGGQTLNDWTTGIYIFVNGVYTGELNITENQGPIDIGEKWETGEVWSYKQEFTTTLTTLSMLVVDKDTNSIVWQSDLLGGATNIPLPPIIAERYTYPSPGRENETLTIFVRVIDPNDDEIIDVHLNLTNIGLTANLTMVENSGNIWSVTMPGKALFSWDNRRITIHAKDENGMSSSAIMALDITPQSDGGGGGGNPGWPPGNLDYSGLQGFAIFEWQDWEDNRFDATPTTIFNWGEEDAVIVVASKYVVNTNNENIIKVLNQTTKVVQTAVSTPNNEFQQYDFISGYYIYNCTIDTSKLPKASNYFLLEASIKDSWVPSNSFTMNARIFVAYPSGTVVGYPKILTFSNSGFSVPEEDFTTFNPTNNMIYVEVQNIYGSPWTPSSGDVEIRDFFWNAQIKRTPAYVAGASSATAWNGPVSNLWQVTALPAPPGVYRFVINLGNATSGWPWIAGDNAYILKFDMFKAGPETYLLNKLVHIESPKNILDIVAGGPPAGAARFQEQSSLFYYANDNNWDGEQLETSNDKHGYSPTVYLTRAGDINGDSRGDFIAAMYDNVAGKYVLHAYIHDPFGSGWIKTLINGNLGGIPKGMELGNIDLDNDLDVTLIGSDNRVYVYRNDGLWTRTTVDSSVTTKVTLLVADMDPPGTPGNDPTRSQDIVVGESNGVMNIFRNKFGDGTAWDKDTLTTAGITNIDSFSDWELNETGTVTNTYLNTQNPFQDPGVYQEIKENVTWRYKETFPVEPAGAGTTSPDPITQLGLTAVDPYTVLSGEVVHINKWDSTGLLDDLTTKSVMLKVRYFTDNYQGGSDYIVYNDGGTLVNTIQITGTAGAWVEMEYDLTSEYPLASQLQNLDLTFQNSFAAGSSVNFDYWIVNVTWATGDQASHIYHFSLPAGTLNQFFVYAAKNNSADIDGFRFYYSTNGTTYSAMTLTPTSTVNSIWPTFIQYSSAATFIPNNTPQVWIKVVDTDRTPASNPVPTWVRIGQMYVTTNAASTPIGDTITAMDLADVDGNGAMDIIVTSRAGNYGKVFVLYNRVNGIFNLANIKQVAVDATSKGSIYNAKWVFSAAFFNPYQKGYLDIVYCTTGAVYTIDQTALGTFSSVAQMTIPTSMLYGATFTLVKPWAGDVDGNGRADLLFATTSGHILYFANYQGMRTTSGWQSYFIDQLTSASGPGTYLSDMDAAIFRF